MKNKWQSGAIGSADVGLSIKHQVGGSIPFFVSKLKVDFNMNPICDHFWLFMSLAFWLGANFGSLVSDWRNRKIWNNLNATIETQKEHIEDLKFDIQIRARDKEKAACKFPISRN
jgi:hypothetical protein